MKIIQIGTLPVAANVCQQVLREVHRENSHWSLAHVAMQPYARSLLHFHRHMAEVYVITRGTGILEVHAKRWIVSAGDVTRIEAGARHRLINTGAGVLEHLVLAAPAFQSGDVHLVEERVTRSFGPAPIERPAPTECFDGATIVGFPAYVTDPVSIAFGWTDGEATRRKAPHYHEHTREWMLVTEGTGYLEVAGILEPVAPGSFAEIEPGEPHRLLGTGEGALVAVCICSPPFSMDDVRGVRTIQL